MLPGHGNEPCCIWRLVDGKPGHEAQSLGLCEALADRLPVSRCDIPVSSKLTHFFDWLLKRFPAGEGLPPPDLIIGAGSRSHFALIAAKQKYGGRSIVLMKPGLPTGWFDLCLIPQHDNVSGDNVLQTQGAINAIRPRPDISKNQTLILIGGVSDHYGWNDDAVIDQIIAIAEANPLEQVVLTTSRRTPVNFLIKLEEAAPANLEIIPWEKTPDGWVSEQLEKSHSVWVTQDSVSMVYESLTAGAAVGLIQLPAHQKGRVSRGVDGLVKNAQVTLFNEWKTSSVLKRSPETINEARRCADWIYHQWLKKD